MSKKTNAKKKTTQKKSGRADGKTSFYDYNRVKKDVYELTGHKFASRTPTGAAKKSVTVHGKGLKMGTEITVIIRKAGTSKLREYTGELVEDVTVEPNSDLNRKVGVRSVIETLTSDDQYLIKRNEYYMKHPRNPRTKKSWSEEDAKSRNAEIISIDEIEIDGVKYNTTLKLLEGEHVVLRSTSSKTKLVRAFAMPEGTPKQLSKEEEEKVEEKDQKKKQGKKKGKKEEVIEEPEEEVEEVTEEEVIEEYEEEVEEVTEE